MKGIELRVERIEMEKTRQKTRFQGSSDPPNQDDESEIDEDLIRERDQMENGSFLFNALASHQSDLDDQPKTLEDVIATFKTLKNWIAGDGVRMVDAFSFPSFPDLKAKTSKELKPSQYCLFPDAWVLMAHCNLSFFFESDELDRGKKIIGNGL